MAAASPRASAQLDALLVVTDDKMDISENVNVDITPIQASATPRRVRVSRNGKNCHQCRQTIADCVASCTNIKGKRRCRVNICRKCLLNRYAEEVDVVSNLPEWSCPKCRNICNCSVCRRKMGCDPTGILAPVAKGSGFSSVHQFIASGQELPKRKIGESSSSKPYYNTNENHTGKKLKAEGGDSEAKEDNIDLHSQSIEEPAEENRASGNTETNEENGESISLQSGNSSNEDVTAVVIRPLEKNIVKIGGEDYPSEDMGPALQFLEFCKAFHEEGHALFVCREMMDGRFGGGESYSWTVRFLQKLFPVLQMNVDPEEVVKSWKEILVKCISRSEYASKYFLCHINNGCIQFDELSPFQKLRVLNLLCDEALGSEILRVWIDNEAAEFFERKKGAKRNAVAAKEKEKDCEKKLKDERSKIKKLKDEIAEEILSKIAVSISEHRSIVSQLRNEAEEARLEKIEAMSMVPITKEADAVRTHPIITDENGRVFWRLKSFSSEESCYMLQEVGDSDAITLKDKWYSFNMEDQTEVENFISFLRKSRNN